MAKICMISLGCAKNLVNSEQMLCMLSDAGLELVGDPQGADVAIINTCGFINDAKVEAIDYILYMGQLKEMGVLKKLIVTGCLAQRYGDQLFEEMPEIDAVVGTGSYNQIIQAVAAVLQSNDKFGFYQDINAPEEECGRIITTGCRWAYLKIAEGCSNNCAYCVIPSIRGKYRSRPMDAIVSEAKALVASGYRELIVVAQDITRYGTDLYGKKSLCKLLRELCAIEDLKWIRLHYLYPEMVDDELISLVAEEEKILKYLDIPIQHISTPVLKRMNRRGTGDDIRNLFAKLKERIPNIVLRTSIIAGLPGETDEDFEELCSFLRKAKIQRAGVFPYSPEEGTPAAEMERPDEDVAKRRAELLFAVQFDVMDEFNNSRIGTTTTVLCEGFDEESGCWYGRSYAESPDVDGRVLFTGEDIEPDEFYEVRITEINCGEPYGERV
ncbi:MAG: 30S ribosomal protein S12 methylthiotransferase RimO [Ruminococcaceae bacterium]|nr:30S ribosomal protein S12 methylthiotransferase RimO [Oscillospiraceae bacterium]